MRALSIGWLLVPLVAAATIGCGDDDDENESKRSTERSSKPSEGASGGEKAVTRDGYEVISASKRSRAKQRAADDDGLVREPNEPDPQKGEFTLQQAVEGLGTDGTLVAEIDTDLGVTFCDLFAEKTPETVANFIGLARGKRPWWNARAGAWLTRRYYDGTTFHRVLPGYLVQGGDYLGDGSGRLGYDLPDEQHPNLRHDEAGLLSMAGAGAGQFFLTDGAATKHLDDAKRYTIFGKCRPVDVIHRIARVPQDGETNEPLTPVRIKRVFVKRVRGGAAKAERTKPKPLPGRPSKTPGASPGPSKRHGGPTR